MSSDLSIAALGAALDGLSARQRVIANNVANVDTPGYTARQVDFSAALAAAVEAGDLSTFQVPVTRSAAPARLNGNNVNIDDEVVTATTTNLEYTQVVESLNARFRILSTAFRPVQ